MNMRCNNTISYNDQYGKRETREIVTAWKRAPDGKQVTVHECSDIGRLVESVNQDTEL